MTFNHVLHWLPRSIQEACIKVGVEYRDVPMDGKPHKTGLINDPLGWGLGMITRPPCQGGAVVNRKTGQFTYFMLPEAFVPIKDKQNNTKKISNPVVQLHLKTMRAILGNGGQR